MEAQKEGVRWKALVWGLALVALGALFLLDRLGIVTVPEVGKWWPVLLIVIGVTRFVDRRPGAGVTWLLLGGWFLVCAFEWRGLTYYNFWPAILVVVGTGIVIRTLSGEDRRRSTPEEGGTS